jgi:aldehyde dehydrogenase (NAD+)
VWRVSAAAATVFALGKGERLMPSVAEIFESMAWGPAPEAAEPAFAWLDRHQRQFQHLVNGQWREATTRFDVFNPANRQVLAQVGQGTTDDVDAAVTAAREAFTTWSTTPGHVRARYLYALARQVQKHSRLFAVLETLDNGKPIRESRDLDVPLVARHLAYHAGWAQIMAEELPDYQPLGVVGQIIPWNFPLLMLAWKVAPALAMGNTVVLKPAEFTPLTALLFAEITQAIGLPPGVFNLVTGDGDTGALLVEHGGVDKIAFTGSTDVGRIIRRATAGSAKRLSLELGGKSPFVVFDDADLDGAIEGLVDAIWFNQGQVCCAGSRLVVQESIEQRFLNKVRTRMAKLRVGDPLDKAIDIGAIVAPSQLERITELVEAGRTAGADVWQPPDACPVDGWFYPPTLITNVGPASELAQTEIFGPVLVAMSFRTPGEAVALANNTRYGLAASVWTQDIDQALDVARGIQAGTVWINSTNVFDASCGFGGYRESGYGREGGREGLFEYVRHVPISAPSSPNGLDPSLPTPRSSLPPIDRTPKLFIGGKQARPDSGYAQLVYAADGTSVLGEVGEGNRKDIRNAVEAARAALPGWAAATSYNRAQILYYLAENLSVRSSEFSQRLLAMTGEDADEVERSVEYLFSAAAYADKWEGRVHTPPLRGAALAVPEPIGVVGVACPSSFPLVGLVSLVAPLVSMGNTVVVIPSQSHPLAATDLYQVLETSDVPVGVINIVTGPRDPLSQVLADHDDVDAMWYVGTPEGRRAVESASAGNMKRTLTFPESEFSPLNLSLSDLLHEATQVKNIWMVQSYMGGKQGPNDW